MSYFINAGFQDVNIGTVLTSANVHYYANMIEHYYKNFGIKRFHLMHLEIPNHRDKKVLNPLKINNESFLNAMISIKKLKEKYSDLIINDSYTTKYKDSEKPVIKGIGCTAGYTHCEILANLDVIPCGMASKFVVGNLGKSSFKNIWHGTLLNSIRLQSDYLCDKNLPTQLF